MVDGFIGSREGMAVLSTDPWNMLLLLLGRTAGTTWLRQ